MSPRWNIVSLFLSLLIIPWTFLLSLDNRDGALGWGGVGAILIAQAGTTTLGLIAGIVALLRRERWLIVTILALLLNLYPVLSLMLQFFGR